jgi:hypothetical protein
MFFSAARPDRDGRQIHFDARGRASTTIGR